VDSSLTLLVDAPSLIYRAFFSTPDSIRAPDGTPMNAAYGFLRMLSRLIADRNPDFICCAVDDEWRPDWRVRLIGSYKTHRMEPNSIQQQTDQQLAAQLPVIAQVLTACGIPVVGHPNHEAEDVIGTLSARAEGCVAIVSGDRDLFQLVRDPEIYVLYPKRGVTEMDRVDEAYIMSRFGIPGRAYRDFAVLRGDPSDGLPGVRGIGDKLASSLLSRYGSLEAVTAVATTSREGIALGKVAQSLDYIERALRVVTIPTDLPIPRVDMTRRRRDPGESAYSLADRYGLRGPVGSMIAALRSSGSPEL